ncbi:MULTISPECIES: DUF6197 family protein [Nocardia]|uniref:DUF6197 family protein n=1 Tax=Nocardia TaxID=1817 RepID=UPI0007A3A2DC|nr:MULTISPECIES: hypothetical protein [Nocardia]
MSVKDNLIKAQEILETEGWCKESSFDEETDSYCLLGAIYSARTGVCGAEIMKAPHDPYEHSPEVEAVADIIIKGDPVLEEFYESHAAKFGKPRVEGIVYSFNDADETTQADVMTVLTKAIEAAS